ncbi:type VI secretion system baseplate subunit TssG [Desulfovibrio sp. ZJ369]|uniref:type VI secretion system baseplate subunit TssG n=1 Tax=Desulfovibrio sp. ZJ369 TaxID=2709793 RepID=UPI0013ED2AC5|nr:type VI secretion system baseplate subunit TssG [Desulfovibrio sp. ZJ369]
MNARPRSPAERTGATPGGVLECLFADPSSFSFVQAVRVLHAAYGAGESVMDFLRARVRVRPHLSLAFPPRDVVSLERISPGGTPAPDGAAGQSLGDTFRITVSVMGLYGAASPLPTFYTEDLLAEAREDGAAGRDFLDVLNAGLFGLFLWGGWFRYHPLRALEEQRDTALLERMFSLAGLGDPDLRQSVAQPRGLLPLAGILSQFPRSAAGLGAFLSSRLKVRVRIRQCVWRQAALPEEQRCRLDGGKALGQDAILGSRVDDANGKIGILLEGLTREDLPRFAHDGEGCAQLRAFMDFYCTEPLDADIHLEMAPGLCRGARLGAGPDTSPAWRRLGCDTWLGDPEKGRAPRLDGQGPHAYAQGFGKALIPGCRWRKNAGQ